MARIAELNVEIAKLADQAGKVNAMLGQENFGYDVLVSQFEQLKLRVERAKADLEAVEQAAVKTREEADRTLLGSREEAKNTRDALSRLYAEARKLFEMVVEDCDKVAKRRIMANLKRLEETPAGVS